MAWHEVVERTIQEMGQNTGLELVHAELQGAGAGRLLRVYIDQPGGVGLEECERASHALSAALDAEPGGEGELAGTYTLEVSSPGLDRPLVKPDDFRRFTGERARVETRTPLPCAQVASRRFVGVIRGAEAGGVRLETAPGTEVVIAWDNVHRARLAPVWPQAAAKPGAGKRSRKSS